eukprot:430523-Rhodomonas_salina.1
MRVPDTFCLVAACRTGTWWWLNRQCCAIAVVKPHTVSVVNGQTALRVWCLGSRALVKSLHVVSNEIGGQLRDMSIMMFYTSLYLFKIDKS